MRNSSERLATKDGNREFPAAVPCAPFTVVLAAPCPEPLSDFSAEEAPTRIDVTYRGPDHQSWPPPPRNSVVRPVRVSAARASARRSPFQHPVGRFLAAGLVSVAIALAGFALLSVASHALPCASLGGQP